MSRAHLAVAGALVLLALLGSRFVSVAIVTGASMSPAIAPGDVCLVVRDAEVCEGDVVLYESPTNGRPVLHRVVEVRENGFRTKGDANSKVDREIITHPMVKGTVSGVLRSSALFLFDW